jgi:hypothetical protein
MGGARGASVHYSRVRLRGLPRSRQVSGVSPVFRRHGDTTISDTAIRDSAISDTTISAPYLSWPRDPMCER